MTSHVLEVVVCICTVVARLQVDCCSIAYKVTVLLEYIDMLSGSWCYTTGTQQANIIYVCLVGCVNNHVTPRPYHELC